MSPAEPLPAGMPPVGSIWRKTAWGDRTVVSHRFNAWGRCWWVTVRHEHGTMEIPLSKWRRWADGATLVVSLPPAATRPGTLTVGEFVKKCGEAMNS